MVVVEWVLRPLFHESLDRAHDLRGAAIGFMDKTHGTPLGWVLAASSG